jgi:hypothetical protein
MKNRYVVFQWQPYNRVHLLREHIVGFRPHAHVVWTDVILDSGAEVALNGMTLEEAKATLEEFDRVRGENPPRPPTRPHDI